MSKPVALCALHRIQTALAIVPDLLREQLAAAEAGVVDATPRPHMGLVTGARDVSVGSLLHGVHDNVVYFVANGGRVKIGYTTNLKSRLGSLALRSDSVLLALSGGPDLERALHAHFAIFRDGNTEWFELSPEIFRYIAADHPANASAPRSAVLAATDYSNPVDRVIRALYESGTRPTTGQMRVAMKAAGLQPTESTARTARKRIERREPHLAALPTNTNPVER